MSDKLEILRSSLLTLKPSGYDGFEGLLSTALTSITGISFRLASSGMQFGVDGASSDKDDLVYFEAKRYDGKITRETVITKIADLGRVKDLADVLWILGATSEVSSQLASQLDIDAQNNGIASVILDWSSNSIPRLAVLIASLGNLAAEWIAKNSTETLNLHELKTAIAEIQNIDGFQCSFSKLQLELNANSIATSNAIASNRKWMHKALSDEPAARSSFGQPILPLDKSNFFLKRKDLSNQLIEALIAEDIIFLLGEEGSGKSWLAADLACQHDGLVLLISAERFGKIEAIDVENLIIDSLITQTGNRRNNSLEKRWQKRIDAWQVTPPTTPIIVIVDGINQRPEIKWDRILVALHAWLSKRSGRLVVTTRPKYFQKKVKAGIGFGKEIKVSDWSVSERDEILIKNSIKAQWMDETTLISLLNPRLLGIAVSNLPKSDIDAWKGLTVSRLLFEHIRLSQRNRYEEETAEIISGRLSKHAKKVLAKIKPTNVQPKLFLQEDTFAVADTRFFRALPGPNNKYELVDEGINLALGFAIVDRIWEAIDNNEGLSTYLNKLIEPILALDRTAEILLAALTVCALDEDRFEATIFESLLEVFADIQNLPENFYDEFFQILLRQPEATLIAIKTSLLEWHKPINHDWLVKVAFDFSSKESVWPIVSSTISDWICHVVITADDQLRAYSRHDKEKHLEQIDKRQNEIDSRIANFSSFEKSIFAKMTVIKGDCDSLLCASLWLLAHKPLASYANDFLKLAIGFSLNHSLYKSRKQFDYLTQFNRVDWYQTSVELENVCVPLRSAETSITGKWALVKLLFTTGLEKYAKEAQTISEGLRSGQKKYPAWRRIEDYCSVDPCDPSSLRPINIDTTIEEYKALDPKGALNDFSRSLEEWFREKALPGIARFAPQVAIDKHLEILNELKIRKNFPLRQLSICGTDLIPLVRRELAVDIVTRLQDTNLTQGIDENERKIVRMQLLHYAYAHLSAKEQLEFAVSGQRTDYLLDITASMKRPKTDDIVRELITARKNNDNDTIFLILALVANSCGAIEPSLADELAKHMHSDSSIVRASVFEIIEKSASEKLLQIHADSNWKYLAANHSSTYEALCGSYALILAASKRITPINKLISRISPTSWYHASLVLGSPINEILIEIIDDEINRTAKEIHTIDMPAVELELSQHVSRRQWWVSIEDASNQDSSPFNSLSKQESNEDFHKRQKHMVDILESLEKTLVAKDIKILIEYIDLELFDKVFLGHQDILEKWAKIFIVMNKSDIRWLRNIALATARFLIDHNSELAISLFKMIKLVEPFVTISVNDGLTLEHKAIWSCPDSRSVQKLWASRIEAAKNDAELFLEVLAAERYGASSFIKKYVSDGYESKVPLNIRYALTIAGFSKQYEYMSSFLGNYEFSESYVGDTATKAHEAYKRATWSEHWLQKMRDATTQDEFWLAMKLTARIADARMTGNELVFDSDNTWLCYASIFAKEKQKRAKKWQTKRKKTLLGIEAPNPLFLQTE